MKFPTYKLENQKFLAGYKLIAGCDEVGIAPLAGPVVAAAVILNPQTVIGKRSKNKWWYRVRDSKTVNEKEREDLVSFIKDNSLSFSVGVINKGVIDSLNIYHAAMAAMRDAVVSLHMQPELVFVDGNHKIKGLAIYQQPVIDGDEKILSISAASILAKVTRDKIMSELHEYFPDYGFNKNKGYPTQFHREAIRLHGVCPEHRRSFALVQECLQKQLPLKV